ncbi:hypothetical protein [Marinivivus vitaminiproducens]|uniref:hypothetical protein n=1 Tax=Marinivivus vitaminiproducens TaxID=3035935 RepID=UPI0027998AE4|nr:hypothetical protein P4R82_20300 [Geminicoccaceae bacterium SCSIO 64248]
MAAAMVRRVSLMRDALRSAILSGRAALAAMLPCCERKLLPDPEGDDAGMLVGGWRMSRAGPRALAASDGAGDDACSLGDAFGQSRWPTVIWASQACA